MHPRDNRGEQVAREHNRHTSDITVSMDTIPQFVAYKCRIFSYSFTYFLVYLATSTLFSFWWTVGRFYNIFLACGEWVDLNCFTFTWRIRLYLCLFGQRVRASVCLLGAGLRSWWRCRGGFWRRCGLVDFIFSWTLYIIYLYSVNLLSTKRIKSFQM